MVGHSQSFSVSAECAGVEGVGTLRVDLILERHDQWNAVLMQEYEQNLKSHLRRAFRQNPKDLNIFVPLSPGSFGHAREVANEINPQLFRLWLDRCRDYHRIICGRQGSAVALKGLSVRCGRGPNATIHCA